MGFILEQDPEPRRVPAPLLGAEGCHFSQKQWVSAELEVQWGVEGRGEGVKQTV